MVFNNEYKELNVVSAISIWQTAWYIILFWVLICGVLLIYQNNFQQKAYQNSSIYKHGDEVSDNNDFGINVHSIAIQNSDDMTESFTGNIDNVCRYVTPALGGYFECKLEKTQTLGEISKKIYGDERLFPVILMQNPQIHQFNLKRGIQLRLLKDSHKAVEIYKENTGGATGHRYWKYTVEKNDTLWSIARKFYDEKKGSDNIVNLNPEIALKRGEKVEIQLE